MDSIIHKMNRIIFKYKLRIWFEPTPFQACHMKSSDSFSALKVRKHFYILVKLLEHLNVLSFIFSHLQIYFNEILTMIDWLIDLLIIMVIFTKCLNFWTIILLKVPSLSCSFAFLALDVNFQLLSEIKICLYILFLLKFSRHCDSSAFKDSFLRTRGLPDIYPLSRPPKRTLAVGRGTNLISGLIISPVTLTVYDVAHSFPLRIISRSMKMRSEGISHNSPVRLESVSTTWIYKCRIIGFLLLLIHKWRIDFL